MLEAAEALAPQVGTRIACDVLSVSRATVYRRRYPRLRPEPTSRPVPWSLTPAEVEKVLALLHSERFVDMAPAEIVATLLDEGTYLCSERTMYRLLEQAGEVAERRAFARHGHYAVPELLAEAPNRVWSWDITKLKGPVKWSYYCLYVILDIFSRKIVGWTIAHRESAGLAEDLIAATCEREGIQAGQLTIHADRGSAMTSKSVTQLLLDLDVLRTHSRPHVSNDNPYSEAQFKTLKYRPDFPERFGSLEHARLFFRGFVNWYNNEHRHSGICMLTPATVHAGRAAEVLGQRHQVMLAAYAAHPERFRRAPQPQLLPARVWINRPADENKRSVNDRSAAD
jgi:putative transposase